MKKHPCINSVQIVAINSENKEDLNYAKGIKVKKAFYKFPATGHYPKLECDYLAIYLTNDNTFKKNKKTIKYYAKILNYNKMFKKKICNIHEFRKRNSHKNNEEYWKLELGKLQKLTPSIKNKKSHGVGYGYTSLEKLKSKKDISELKL